MRLLAARCLFVAVALGGFALAPIRSEAAKTCLDSLRSAIHNYQIETGAQKALDLGQLQGKFSLKENVPCIVGTIISASAQAQREVQQEALKNIVPHLKSVFQQNGSTIGSGSGSTNVVSKGAVANILSMATEYGALTQTSSGQSVTLQGTLAGIPTAMLRTNVMYPCTTEEPTKPCLSPRLVANLERVSYSVAFDASPVSPQLAGTASGSDSSTVPVTFNANYHSIDSVTTKVEIIRGSLPSSDQVNQAIVDLSTKSTTTSQQNDPKSLDTVELNAAEAKLSSDFAKDNELKKRQSSLEKASPDDIETEWNSLGGDLIKELCTIQPCPLADDAAAYAVAYLKYVQREQSFFESLRNSSPLTAEYAWNSPSSQPTNSTIRLIGALPVTGGLAFTLNAAGSWYNSSPSSSIPGARRLRDFQIAAEGNYSFSGAPKNVLGQSTVSLAYYYQDQTSPPVLNVTPGQPVSGVTFTNLPSGATQVFAERGVINLGQTKFTFVPGKLGISIPLSVTWSNRSELVVHSVWHGQVGLSYDLDSLFSAIGR